MGLILWLARAEVLKRYHRHAKDNGWSGRAGHYVEMLIEHALLWDEGWWLW